MAKTKKDYLQSIATLRATGQGYAGLGPQELKRRQNQAKYLTKKAGAKADKLEYQANYLETTGYPDIFGDKKYLRKKAEGQRKIEQQFDKQYNRLMKGKVTGQKVQPSPADYRARYYKKRKKLGN